MKKLISLLLGALALLGLAGCDAVNMKDLKPGVSTGYDVRDKFGTPGIEWRNDAGNVTSRADTSNATVDTQAPTVTAARISVSGATGTGGVFKVGDTVTATWKNSASGGGEKGSNHRSLSLQLVSG